MGIFNTYVSWARGRVSLQVKPKRLQSELNAPLRATHQRLARGEKASFHAAIEVINQSTFPVTIDEIGFLYRGAIRGTAVEPMLLDRGEWPRRLEPHSSVTVVCSLTLENAPYVLKIAQAYAKTPSGHAAKGKSPALTEMHERFRMLSNQEYRELEAERRRQAESR